MRNYRPALLALTLASPAAALPSAVQRPAPAPRSNSWIADSEALSISYRVWENESGGRSDGLTWWNRGEAFASVGIGHFIWFPAGTVQPFKESFPSLLAYMEERGVELPEWLRGYPPCPWPDRASYRRDLDSPRMQELRNLLTRTLDLQARFMADRLERALPGLLKAAPAARRDEVLRRFDALASQSEGLYALVDYTNFKGEGLVPPERYRGQGWGLLQVLLRMRGEPQGHAALEEFSRAAGLILARRVRNAPPERREWRWLNGWRRRVRTYRPGS
ncbi:MAG: hypothetical protein HY554_02745 [Elusimicrobia bacterium]|nr:hypothetical protein [Elusimicrobiota bacterium]